MLALATGPGIGDRHQQQDQRPTAERHPEAPRPPLDLVVRRRELLERAEQQPVSLPLESLEIAVDEPVECERGRCLLERGDVIMVAEGLDVFRTPVPPPLAGTRLRDSRIREQTGCHLVAWQTQDGMRINPPPNEVIPDVPGTEIILVGTTEAEQAFLARYGRR
jgi:hypothetical protein